jgi:uncharacterized protein YidB (DUF937 family)
MTISCDASVLGEAATRTRYGMNPVYGLLTFADLLIKDFAMGLLDSILGGIAGSAFGRLGGIGMGRPGRGTRGNLVVALLPVVLSMLANRRRGAMAPGFGTSGGLGGLGALAGMGGLGALLERFQQKGYGDQVQSWISTGENQPIPPDAVSEVFDHNELSQIASQAGVSEDEAREGLSELLPQVVDNFTPQGQLPDSDQLSSTIDQLMQEMQQGQAPQS